MTERPYNKEEKKSIIKLILVICAMYILFGLIMEGLGCRYESTPNGEYETIWRSNEIGR